MVEMQIPERFDSIPDPGTSQFGKQRYGFACVRTPGAKRFDQNTGGVERCNDLTTW